MIHFALHFDYIFDRKQPRKVTRNDLKKSKIQNEHSQKIPKLLVFLDFCRCSLGLLIIAKMRAPKRKAARSNRAGDAIIGLLF
jgi:hypothetical protein